jgi:hypothetical protein
MNLFIYPALPLNKNGYEIAVKNDFKKCNPEENDIVIWYSNVKLEESPKNFYYLPRPDYFSSRSIFNILSGRSRSELSPNDLSKILIGKKFNRIFCGDVIFYRALRKLFPDSTIEVRFHNCFARIRVRMHALRIEIKDPIFKLNLKLLSKIENEIMRDKNVFKHFISDFDRQYYIMIKNYEDDSDVWGIMPEIINGLKPVNYKPITKIVWFGGVETHKADSVNWFVKNVFPQLLSVIPSLEFHLWGNRTERFNAPEKNIYAHGFYNDNDFPYIDEALYINPDIIGGGVKIKLSTYIENGVRFITTPFGFEGYDKKLINNRTRFVIEEDNWINSIINIIQTQNY